MEKFKKILHNEVFLYLIFGVATTLVYMAVRSLLFMLLPSIEVVVFLANSIAILFAFVTNDRIVFKQERRGWQSRLFKFLSARIVTLLLDLLLAIVLVRLYPEIIGQFVGHNLETVNFIATVISQIAIIVANYVLSKLFVFKRENT